MPHYLSRLLLLVFLIAGPPSALAEESGQGIFSLVTNPQVMVYMDGRRLGMSPLINQRLDPGDHQMALLLIMPNGNRLRADYRVVISAGRETSASVDLVANAPREGEVRTIGPAAPAAPANPTVSRPANPTANPPANPTANPTASPTANPTANPTGRQQSSWANNPGRPSQAPVTVAPRRPDPPPAPAAPEPRFGLSREMVREGLEAMRPAVERCMAGRTGIVQVRVVIQPDGGVSEVEAQGVYRGTEAGECIESTLPDEAAFPIYVGEPIPVVYPYRISER